MSKKFSTLRAKMTPEAQALAAAKAEAMLVEMELQQLRKIKNVTQSEIAEILQVEQASISKMERRTDMYVSSLSQYVRALGGELKLVAAFPDQEIQLHQFQPA